VNFSPIVEAILNHLLLGGGKNTLGLLFAHVHIVKAVVRRQGVGWGNSVRLVILGRS